MLKWLILSVTSSMIFWGLETFLEVAEVPLSQQSNPSRPREFWKAGCWSWSSAWVPCPVALGKDPNLSLPSAWGVT